MHRWRCKMSGILSKKRRWYVGRHPSLYVALLSSVPGPIRATPQERHSMGTHSDTSVLTVPHIDNPEKSSRTEMVDREELRHRIELLGDWFHNLDLYGIPTAPNHFLGDFPNVKWKPISKSIPEDLTGASVLDIGCNGGFYSIALKKRGAQRVVGVDIDDRYLNQARFAASVLGLEIEFEKRSVYEIDGLPGQF